MTLQLTDIVIILFIIGMIKGIAVGSEFNFIHWIRYGKLYMRWYKNHRQTFKEFKDRWHS